MVYCTYICMDVCMCADVLRNAFWNHNVNVHDHVCMYMDYVHIHTYYYLPIGFNFISCFPYFIIFNYNGEKLCRRAPY